MLSVRVVVIAVFLSGCGWMTSARAEESCLIEGAVRIEPLGDGVRGLPGLGWAAERAGLRIRSEGSLKRFTALLAGAFAREHWRLFLGSRELLASSGEESRTFEIPVEFEKGEATVEVSGVGPLGEEQSERRVVKVAEWETLQRLGCAGRESAISKDSTQVEAEVRWTRRLLVGGAVGRRDSSEQVASFETTTRGALILPDALLEARFVQEKAGAPVWFFGGLVVLGWEWGASGVRLGPSFGLEAGLRRERLLGFWGIELAPALAIGLERVRLAGAGLVEGSPAVARPTLAGRSASLLTTWLGAHFSAPVWGRGLELEPRVGWVPWGSSTLDGEGWLEAYRIALRGWGAGLRAEYGIFGPHHGGAEVEYRSAGRTSSLLGDIKSWSFTLSYRFELGAAEGKP